jgi:large subunit ribosomal protein L15
MRHTGRQILALEATRSVLASSIVQAPEEPDQWGRTPFEHPALAIVDKLHAKQPRDIISKDKMEKLAHDVGLPAVTRWKPRLVCSVALPC